MGPIGIIELDRIAVAIAIQIQPQGITAVRVRPRILLCESARRRIIVSRPKIIRPTLGIEILSCIAEGVAVQRIEIFLHTVCVVLVVPRQRANQLNDIPVRVIQIRLAGGIAHQYYSIEVRLCRGVGVLMHQISVRPDKVCGGAVVLLFLSGASLFSPLLLKRSLGCYYYRISDLFPRNPNFNVRFVGASPSFISAVRKKLRTEKIFEIHVVKFQIVSF